MRPVNIVAVSKTFSLNHIQPLIDHGHNHFGENKVQEAFSKWHELKKSNNSLNLHMIGKLQSNKAKKAVEIFDYIHSLDNQKLADILSREQQNLGKKLKYFILIYVIKIFQEIYLLQEIIVLINIIMIILNLVLNQT